jgi:integrase
MFFAFAYIKHAQNVAFYGAQFRADSLLACYPEGALSGTQLTTRAVANAKPRRDAAGNFMRTERGDGNGLYLAIEPSGAKSWASRYRFQGRPRRFVFAEQVWCESGPAPEGFLSLAGARARHAAIKNEVKQGRDPAAARRAHKADARAEALQRDADSVAALWAKFIALRVEPRASKGHKRMIKAAGTRFVLPAWGKLSVHELRRRHLIALTDPIAVDRPYLANRVVSVCTAFASWLVKRDVIAASPFTGIEMPGKEVSRERVLSDAELAALVPALEAEGAAGAMALVLAHTGARFGEVAGMTWDEIDAAERVWRLPETRSKNRRAHDVPLSRQVLAIIDAQPRIVGCPYVFTTTGEGPITHVSRLKQRLDQQLHFAEHWQFHDLRRSCASGLQRLKYPVEVIEAVLNHRSGVFRGIVGVYQRHPFTNEKRAALQEWSDHIDGLVAGEPSTVVHLSGRKRR